MPNTEATLHLMCGKIAAGKSSLAAELGRQPGTIVLSEDQWLTALYPREIQTVFDYARCSARLREAIAPHIVALLQSGLSVVLDIPANTIAFRAWMRGLFESAGSAHRLHYLDLPDDVCRARLHRRNAAGQQARVSDEMFDIVTSYFVAPTAEEGFDITLHRA